MYVLICDTFCLTCPVVFSYMYFVDLPLLVVVKVLQSLCCVMFHIYVFKYIFCMRPVGLSGYDCPTEKDRSTLGESHGIKNSH